MSMSAAAATAAPPSYEYRQQSTGAARRMRAERMRREREAAAAAAASSASGASAQDAALPGATTAAVAVAAAAFGAPINAPSTVEYSKKVSDGAGYDSASSSVRRRKSDGVDVATNRSRDGSIVSSVSGSSAGISAPYNTEALQDSLLAFAAAGGSGGAHRQHQQPADPSQQQQHREREACPEPVAAQPAMDAEGSDPATAAVRASHRRRERQIRRAGGAGDTAHGMGQSRHSTSTAAAADQQLPQGSNHSRYSTSPSAVAPTSGPGDHRYAQEDASESAIIRRAKRGGRPGVSAGGQHASDADKTEQDFAVQGQQQQQQQRSARPPEHHPDQEGRQSPRPAVVHHGAPQSDRRPRQSGGHREQQQRGARRASGDHARGRRPHPDTDASGESVPRQKQRHPPPTRSSRKSGRQTQQRQRRRSRSRGPTQRSASEEQYRPPRADGKRRTSAGPSTLSRSASARSVGFAADGGNGGGPPDFGPPPPHVKHPLNRGQQPSQRVGTGAHQQQQGPEEPPPPERATVQTRGIDCVCHIWRPVFPPSSRPDSSSPHEPTSKYEHPALKRGRPRAAVVVFHGLGGHSLFPTVRYLAELLQSQQYVVYGLDLPGHGRSPGPRGLIASADDLVKDGMAITVYAKRCHPDLPIFLAGSSMGGAVALAVSHEFEVMRSKNAEAGATDAVVSGMVLMAPMVSVSVPRWQRRLLRGLNSFMPKKALFPPAEDATELQFRDPERRAEVESDDLSYKGSLRVASALSCLTLTRRVHRGLDAITTPFLCLVGSEDVVVDNDTARTELMDLAPVPDKALKEYEALHGLLCESQPLRGEIEDDILDWLFERTDAGTARHGISTDAPLPPSRPASMAVAVAAASAEAANPPPMSSRGLVGGDGGAAYAEYDDGLRDPAEDEPQRWQQQHQRGYPPGDGQERHRRAQTAGGREGSKCDESVLSGLEDAMFQ